MRKKDRVRKLFRLACDERGSEMVEFALSAMMLMGLMVGMIGLATAMYTYHFVSSAAQQGLRFAQVRGYTWSAAETTDCSTSAPPNFTMVYTCTASAGDIQNYVQSLATAGITASNVKIDETSSYVWPGKTPDNSVSGCSPSNSQGCLVKVTVSYTFKFLPIQKLSAWTFSATSEGAILQ